jgi:hypothetical protein
LTEEEIPEFQAGGRAGGFVMNRHGPRLQADLRAAREDAEHRELEPACPNAP